MLDKLAPPWRFAILQYENYLLETAQHCITYPIRNEIYVSILDDEGSADFLLFAKSTPSMQFHPFTVRKNVV